MSKEEQQEKKEVTDAIKAVLTEQEAKTVADENKDKEQSKQVSSALSGCG